MKKILAAVEKNRNLILDAERYIWNNPETGFKEFKTSRYLEEKFTQLDYTLVKPDGLTGFCAELDTGREGPELLILGEMDAVVCPAHPAADPQTGAVHACGHNVQSAVLLGIAAALKEPGILDGLSGRIRLCAIPAEELIEVEYRMKLMEQGKIRYLGGKSEFLSRGLFDSVDLAMIVHTSRTCTIRAGSVGLIAKQVIYKGKAAHAGSAPWLGNNALYAATCGLNAVNAIRETFKEPDQTRVHPIVTHGGDMVNAVPETAILESYVRGSTFEAIKETNRKVNRALTGAALSLGTNIEIIDMPGYGPLRNNKEMMQVAREALELVDPTIPYVFSDAIGTGSTDMGDLSGLMPVVHPYVAGITGNSHGHNYEIADPETACITNAKWQMTMIHLLLGNGASRAKQIVEAHTPVFTSKEEYFTFIESLRGKGDRIVYNEDGTASVKV